MISDLKKGLIKARNELIASIQSEAAIVGADASALIENRIVTKGEKADGGKFSPYSTKPVAAFRYFGRSRNAGGEAQVRKAAKAKQGVSYEDFRRFNGLNTSVKSFQFSGEMWQGFGVSDVRQVSPGRVEVSIGGKNARSKLLLKAHSDREGASLTENSKSELSAISKGFQQRLLKIIQRKV